MFLQWYVSRLLPAGLIIDAFGELRDQLEQVKEDMEVGLRRIYPIFVFLFCLKFLMWSVCVQQSVCLLTPSLRRPCIHAIFILTACRTACKHAFCFLRVMPEVVSTRHSWLWQTLDDVYTRRCFSESDGTCFGAPGQKALPSGNEWMEWNEWMDFCLIPLSTTCSVEVPGTNL